MSRWWTLPDLFSVCPERELIRLLDGPVAAGDPAYVAVEDACDRAQRIVAEMLGSRAPVVGEPIAAVIIECVVVMAAWHLSFRSDQPDITEKYATRYKDCKKMLEGLRDGTAAPRVEGGTISVRARAKRFDFL